MPTTYADLEDEGRHSITVRIRDCSSATVEKRAFELSVEDVDGTRFPFIVWEKSTQGRDYEWQVGHWYRLEGVMANSWPSGKVLHGATNLSIEHLGPRRTENQADILYLTDSHLGKQRHSYGGNSWSVSPEDGFQAAIEFGISEEVDAVIHGGDLFHNPGSGIGEKEIAICRKHLIRLAESGIPFYYIYGNHEREAGRRVMDRLVDDSLAVHLGPQYETVGDEFALYGIDHHSQWSPSLLNLQPAPPDLVTVLFVHQSMTPFSEKNAPDCTLHELHRGTTVSLDVIAVGHNHSRATETINETTGVAGGSTARLGDNPTSLSPSVELISTPGSTVNRQLL